MGQLHLGEEPQAGKEQADNSGVEDLRMARRIRPLHPHYRTETKRKLDPANNGSIKSPHLSILRIQYWMVRVLLGSNEEVLHGTSLRENMQDSKGNEALISAQALLPYQRRLK